MKPNYSDYQNYQQQPQTPMGPNNPISGIGKKLVLIFILPIIIGAGILSVFIFPQVGDPVLRLFSDIVDPGPLKGEMLDAAYIPETQKLWILTDSSTTYLLTVETPGEYSMGRECVSCRTITYIYDPVTEEVIKEWETPYPDIPRDMDLYYENGNIWMAGRPSSDYEPAILKYNAETGEQIYNTDTFIEAFPELSAGIVDLYTREFPERYEIKTADGLEFIFVLENEKIFKNNQEMEEYFSPENDKTVTVFGLGDDNNSNTRKKIYLLTGPYPQIGDWVTGSCNAHLSAPDTLEFFCDSTAKLLSDQVFLEAKILYQDEETAVVLHQDSIGRDAKRFLTAIDTSGITVWEIPQEEMFNEIAYNPDDPFTQLFFMQSDIKAEKAGDIFLFILDGIGVDAFDYKTGQKLWRVIP